ncbi:MAG: DnaD domain protein [Defluviitaleaceae bacterium]|nr:DnaD domain protein [Defluviitaleaceae bacterium]
MSAIQMKLGYKASSLELPYIFIDNYLTGCAPVYPLIYIYSLRRLYGGEAVSMADISAHFGILDTDVVNAWRHFEKVGLVEVEGCPPDISITFLPITEPKVETEKSKIIELPETQSLAQTGTKIETRPQYTVQELSVYRTQSKDVERLFSKAETSLGKLLTYNDMNVIFGFYDWLRLPLDVIEYLFCYCQEHGHRNLRYIEKCAMDWSERDIDDLDKALTYVHTFDKNYRSILKQLGKSGFPTPAQRKQMDKWLHEMNMPLSLILDACDRTALSADKPSLSYVDKILVKWHKQGITTIEGVKEDDAAFTQKKEEKEEAKVTAKAPKPKNNRFINFDQRENDYTQIEQLERQYLLKQLKG